jgi:N-methylhydantoinase A
MPGNDGSTAGKEGAGTAASLGSCVIAVDIGGTFTDCVVLSDGGTVTLAKAFSTPPDFSGGILDAVAVAAQSLQLEPSALLSRATLFLHSTTIAENALVDGTLAQAALLTTRGHEDTLRATRGGYGRWSGLTDDEKRNVIDTDKPVPLIPRASIYGVSERVDARGDVLKPAARDEIEAALRMAVESGAEAIGACFLWSFANPENERIVAEVAKRVCPDVFLTLSHEVAPILGEYERTSTVALNSRLGPVVRGYLDALRSRLAEEGFAGTLLVMQAHGGLLPFELAAQRPVGMLESGPVSGIVGASDQGRSLGLRNIIAADMGGTTFKVGVVRDGLVEYQREPMVLRYHYALPKMDVVSLGLAGGSVIAIEPRTGLPQIGPRSAGSYPGPVSYDHGGTEPTITDVDAILGYLHPDFFNGGRSRLNIEKATDVFTKSVADPLGMSAIDAAAAIYKMANSMFFDLLHKVTVRRGIDPRGFALFSFGGTAGMHAAAYGKELGVDPIVVPQAAAVQGAYGLVISDVVHEEQITRPMSMPADLGALNAIVSELRFNVAQQLHADGFSASDQKIDFYVDISYRRQVHILTVPLAAPSKTDELLSEATIEDAVNRFEQLYREKYGPESGYREAGIELVTFRARGAGLLPRLEPQPEQATSADPSSALVEVRQAWVAEHERMEQVPGYSFAELHHGAEVRGPAIIWSPITTVVVAPSNVARVDEHRNLLLWNRPLDHQSQPAEPLTAHQG